jgi:hypothetical protein
MMAEPRYGNYSPAKDDDQNLAIGIATISVVVAFVSATAPFLLHVVLQLLGLGFAQPIVVLAIMLALVLPVAWVILLIWGVRAIGRRGLWLLIAAPLAVAPFWFPAVPGLCSGLVCTYVAFGPVGFRPPPSLPVYSTPPTQRTTPALAAIQTGTS